MTREDFRESLDAVLMAELGDAVPAWKLQALKKAIIARVDEDWDPFEDDEPLDFEDEASFSPEDDEEDYVDD